MECKYRKNVLFINALWKKLCHEVVSLPVNRQVTG